MVYPLSLRLGFLRRPASGIHVVVSPVERGLLRQPLGKGFLFWPISTLVSHGQIRMNRAHYRVWRDAWGRR